MLRLNRDGLAQTGMAVAEIKAREAAPSGELFGVQILLNGAGRHQPGSAATRRTRSARARGTRRRPAPASAARFNDYTVEVVQKIGADSFVGGHGVLLGKTKNSSSNCAGFALQPRYIDANPQDINQVDYVKADGTPVKATHRRRAPAQRRHVPRRHELGLEVRVHGHGNNLNSTSSTRARARRRAALHVGIKSLAGAGPQARGVG